MWTCGLSTSDLARVRIPRVHSLYVYVLVMSRFSLSCVSVVLAKTDNADVDNPHRPHLENDHETG
jgi:hypothetical protein